ncbi:MAG: hypothetical protein ACOH10_00285 [Rhodoglobus sp.]
MPQEFWSNAIYSVTPTILVGLVFWFVIRAILKADGNERKMRSRIEAEERAKIAVKAEPKV